ncbi:MULTISPECIES: glyoxylate/hydroxypyruvate reductase A [unclassified Pseudoalteromonas]|uniref:2-hydroxyacid dehydrogenase n=1 Tax=unclassified Pseudoalteromonas TaxID=194690 RepID=UPI000731DCD1|nr:MULTISPECIES: glyoxylate/hydroxypyruvate reductase A [unclassified Pseudoalteromonas]KTD98852.1 glyoxylate/hydroxypyruvate reductase A [Pseudoalteromonas sp. H71]MBW4965179.1 glyoxylate/hydroxypyruvate reductase A [Pseudoalteromonas sp. CR1]TMN85796.1 glyoxylate/hydroxypyruvate reductase A [Pseudoalteromonas sp. S410]TMN93124.1 glyoxylate/hydroxypyruvate reductase A [Pseudoalteromonas sp. S408]TMN99615.1 glyoxylate/hydroxypyruvate reductase A [Pseudoalteromonas sp. S407]|tara:strand:+ start:240 stop:1160 length:921 start_codon:yes stop_codon:yes gene_type:complete
MSVLVAITGRDNTKLIEQLQARLPSTQIQQWPDCNNLESIDFVLAWKAPQDMWAKLPNLKAVSSFGAGVDSIDLSLLGDNIDVVRIVDEKLAQDMAEYVLTHVLAQKLRLKEYFIKQTQQQWKPKRAYEQNKVGILGFGELGKACAKQLIANNFSVNAWAHTHKTSNTVNLFYGEQGLQKMLSNIDYLICLLPLTKKTKGIINKSTISMLPNHAVIINVARGEHVIEADLLNALEENSLRAAVIDVFEHEPLGKEHPYWQHDKITLTPHCAALSDINSVTAQIAENVERLQQGITLNNRIDRTKGY